MDLYKLKDELTNDPLTRGYSGMSDQAAADSLNTEDRTIKQEVPSDQVLSWAGGNSRYQKVKATSENTIKSDSIRSIALTGLGLLGRDGTAFNPSDANHIGMLDALVADGTLVSSDKDALLALGDKTVSRATELGLPVVRPGEVAMARGL